MPDVTVGQSDVAQAARDLALENLQLRSEKAALSRTIMEMDAKITAMEAGKPEKPAKKKAD